MRSQRDWSALPRSARERCRIGADELVPEQVRARRRDRRGQLLTPAMALAAAKLVKTGKIYSLGIRSTRRRRRSRRAPGRSTSSSRARPAATASGRPRPPTTTTSYMGWAGIGTQLDGSATSASTTSTTTATRTASSPRRRAQEARHREDPADGHARRVLDMAAHFGVDVVKEGTAFNRNEIDEAAKKQGIEIRKGDVVHLPHRLAQPGRQGRQALRLGRARPRPEGAHYLAARTSSRSAPTPGRSR